jgi:hypothetical protein
MRRDKTTLHTKMRPIVKDQVSGNAAVGPAFNDIYTITESIDLKSLIYNTGSNALPVSKGMHVLMCQSYRTCIRLWCCFPLSSYTDSRCVC